MFSDGLGRGNVPHPMTPLAYPRIRLYLSLAGRSEYRELAPSENNAVPQLEGSSGPSRATEIGPWTGLTRK